MTRNSLSLTKKIALVAGAIAVSFAYAVLSIGLLPISLGAYVVDKVFPPRAGGPYDLSQVLLVHMGTDFALCLAIVTGLYLRGVKVAAGRN